MEECLSELSRTLDGLSKCARGLTELLNVMVEINTHRHSQEIELFDRFNEFVCKVNQTLDADLPAIILYEDSRCLALDKFNYVVNYINEKHNTQIPYIHMHETGYNEAFSILESMKKQLC